MPHAALPELAYQRLARAELARARQADSTAAWAKVVDAWRELRWLFLLFAINAGAFALSAVLVASIPAGPCLAGRTASRSPPRSPESWPAR